MADDFDLQEELLQVAGRARGTTKKRSRKAASDSNEESSDLDFSDSDGDRPSSSRKPAPRRGKPVATKRGKQQEEDSDSESEGDDGYGSDLYEDDADRERLMAMTELDREMILAERAEERDKAKQRKALLRAAQDTADKAEARGPRLSNRQKKSSTDKNSAIKRIEAARKRQEQGSRGRHRVGDDEDDDDDSDAEEQRPHHRQQSARKPARLPGERSPDDSGNDGAKQAEMANRKGAARRPANLASIDEQGEAAATAGLRQEKYRGELDSGEDSGAEEAAPSGRAGPEHGRQALGEEGEDPAELEDVRSCQLTRLDLEKLWDIPAVDGQGLQGACVRMAYGQAGTDPASGQPIASYWLMKIQSIVKQAKPYPFGPRQLPCHKCLEVTDGSGHARVMPMTVVSSKPLEQAELDRFNRHATRTDNPILTKSDIAAGLDNINKARSFTWDTASIRANVEAKRQAGAAPLNRAAERARLRRLLDAAEADNNQDDIARLEGQLRDLDAQAMAGKSNDVRTYGMTHVNKRNQQANFNQSFMGGHSKPIPDSSTTGTTASVDAGKSDKKADPFSRRSTRPTIYWNTSKGKPAGAQHDGGTQASTEGASQNPVSQSGILSSNLAMLDTVDLIRVLDLDVEILQPSIMDPVAARLLGPRWQRSLTCSMNHDPKRTSVLTVEEYKARAYTA